MATCTRTVPDFYITKTKHVFFFTYEDLPELCSNNVSLKPGKGGIEFAATNFALPKAKAQEGMQPYVIGQGPEFGIKSRGNLPKCTDFRVTDPL